MKRHDLRVNSKSGLLLSLSAFLVPLSGLILLIYVSILTKLELGEYNFLIYLLFPACLIFLGIALRTVMFVLCGKHTIIYDEKKLIIQNSAIGIKTKKEFLWVDVKRIGLFKKSQNSRGLGSAVCVEASTKYIFGHLLSDNQKESLATELWSFHKDRKGR